MNMGEAKALPRLKEQQEAGKCRMESGNPVGVLKRGAVRVGKGRML